MIGGTVQSRDVIQKWTQREHVAIHARVFTQQFLWRQMNGAPKLARAVRGILQSTYLFAPQHIPGIRPIYKTRNISEHIESFFSKLSGFLALTIVARHAKNQGRLPMVFW